MDGVGRVDTALASLEAALEDRAFDVVRFVNSATIDFQGARERLNGQGEERLATLASRIQEIACDEENDVEDQMQTAVRIVKVTQRELNTIQEEAATLKSLLETLSQSITTTPVAAVHKLKELQQAKGNISAAQGRISHATRWKELLRVVDQELSTGAFSSAAVTVRRLLACG